MGRGLGGLGIISANVSTIFGEFHRGILLFFYFLSIMPWPLQDEKEFSTTILTPGELLFFRKRTVS